MEPQPPRTVDEVATIRSVRGGQASPVRARGAKAPQEVGGAREEVCRLGGDGVGCRFEKPEDGGAGNTSEPESYDTIDNLEYITCESWERKSVRHVPWRRTFPWVRHYSK